MNVIPPEITPRQLGSPVSSQRVRKHSATKFVGDLRSPTSLKSAGVNKTPTKSRTQSTDDKPKTPKSKKNSALSDTKNKATPTKTHRASTSEDGKSRTTPKSKNHGTQDGSPKKAANYNGEEIASTSKPRKQSLSDQSPTSKTSKENIGDKPVFSKDKESLSSPKLDKSVNQQPVVVVIDDESSQDSVVESTQTLMSPKDKNKYMWPIAKQYKYEVKLYSEKGAKNKDKTEQVIVSASQVG